MLQCVFVFAVLTVTELRRRADSADASCARDTVSRCDRLSDERPSLIVVVGASWAATAA